MFRRKPKSDVHSRRAAAKAIKWRGGPTQKYSKVYTTKQWKKFSPDAQQILTNRYNVTLSDHITRKEKLKKLTNSLKKTNVTSSLQKVDSGIGKFDRHMKQFDMDLRVIDDTFTKPSAKHKYDFTNFTTFDKSPRSSKSRVNSFLPKYL